MLYHDRCTALLAALQAAAARDPSVAALMTRVEVMAREASNAPGAQAGSDEAIGALRRSEVGAAAAHVPPAARKAVELLLLSFLRANKRVLPGYFIPQGLQLPPPPK